MNYIEWIGYLGSVIIAVSLTMTSMVKLRWLNFIGALVFAIYGVVIKAIPVALVNGFITAIDIYYLYKMYTTKDFFKLMDSNKYDAYLKNFLSFYEKNIHTHFPEFANSIDKDAMCILTLRNMDIAGVFIAHIENDTTLIIDLDFAIPQYQDFKTGRFLFIKNQQLFKDKGIKKIEVKASTKSQHGYYSKMGFVEENDTFVKTI